MAKVFSKKRVRQAERREPRSHSHTILLVDDEQANIRVLATMLADHYKVITADDGTTAIDAIEQMDDPRQISLVISDQRMPLMTGLQMFERLDTLLPSAKRIILTGYMDVSVILAAINRAHIYQFILKPFDRDEMLLTVQRAIEAYEMEIQLQAYVEQLEQKVAERTEELERAHDQLKEAYLQVEESSLTDSLTGLRNRRFLQQHFDSDLSLVRRERHEDPESDQDLLFILADIDHFKPVNDRHGHEAGDRLLEQFADRLREVYRGSDLIVRWGGEEFLIIARFARRDGGGSAAERLRSAIADAAFEVGDGLKLEKTCSIGFAPFPFFAMNPDALSWSEVVALADRALYAAKHSGRNRWVGIEPNNASGTDEARALMTDPARMEREGYARVCCSEGDPSGLTWN